MKDRLAITLQRKPSVVFFFLAFIFSVLFYCIIFFNDSLLRQTKAIEPFNVTTPKDPFIVHFIKLVKDPKPFTPAKLCFSECVSLLSVMVNIEFDWVFIHTNVPCAWEAFPCRNFTGINWDKVRIIKSPLKYVIGGKNVSRIEHEADVKKLEVVRDFGGIAMDFDVFLVNGPLIHNILERKECILAHERSNDGIEGTYINAGFIVCKRGAVFLKQWLDVYDRDFRPDLWVYNSAFKPYEIYLRNPENIHLDDSVDNSPAWINRGEMLDRRGLHSWRDKLGLHTFMHDCKFDDRRLVEANTTVGELLRWICQKGAYLLPVALPSTTTAATTVMTTLLSIPKSATTTTSVSPSSTSPSAAILPDSTVANSSNKLPYYVTGSQ